MHRVRSRFDQLAKLPLSGRVVIMATVAVGAALAFGYGELPRTDQVPGFLSLLAAAVLASAFKLQLPTSKNRATMSASFVVDFTSLLLFGAHMTSLVAAAGALSQSMLGGRRNPPHRTLFNVACFVITIEATGLIYRMMGGSTGRLAWPADATPLAVAALAYFLVNSGLVALVIAFTTAQSVRRVWQQNFLWSGPNYFIGTALAAALVEMIANRMWGFLPLIAVPVYLTYRAYSVYAERLEHEHRHREIIESLSEGMAVIDRDGQVTLWNDALQRIVGLDRERALGRDLFQVTPGLVDDRLRQMVHATIISGEPQSLDSVVLLRDDGRRILQVRTFPYVGGVTLFWNDVTDRAHAEMELRRAAHHDALTGLPNRSLFIELLGQAVEGAKRDRACRCAVLFLDIDRFKVINDSLGHQVGDDLLVTIARRLQSCVRNGDAVARMGGDEFTILLTDVSGTHEVVAVAQRIQTAMQVPVTLDGREIFTSASIGITLNLPDHTSPDDVMRDADSAMYRAKSLGRARYELFDTKMHAEAIDRLGFENDLRRAVERKELTLCYQPIVLLETGQFIGLETLVRWDRAGHPISPSTFIPVAEELGIIEPLGSWVLQEACRQFADWQRRLPGGPIEHITVNVSAQQLVEPNFVAIVQDAIRGAHMDSQALHLEITETALIDNPEVVERVLHELRAFGVKIYLDDFGTGFSSLSHLHRLPVDALKIDRSFVGSLMTRDRPAIVESILALARTLDTPVIAEGVETQAQLRELTRLGCSQAQGFLFSHPLSTRATEELLADGGTAEGRRLRDTLTDRSRRPPRSTERSTSPAVVH
jgi:diguanylate cyclase (GGDEF)-like protein/PAS domain S-box-containing protein